MSAAPGAFDHETRRTAHDQASDISATTAMASTTTTELSPDKTYVLRFDGGSRGNPGVAGAGMVLYDADEGQEVWSGYSYMGDKYTNNEAEYTGILEGLRCAYAMGARSVVIQGDSLLVIKQLEGAWRVKADNLRPYHQKALNLLKQFDSFHVCHIERAQNSRADELANEAMDSRTSRLDL
jgi:ribonuclease HI